MTKSFIHRFAHRPLVSLALIGVAGYCVLIFTTFLWQHQYRHYGDGYSVLWSTKSASFQPQGDGFQGFHDIVLRSLNTATMELSAIYSVNETVVGDIAYVCPWFGHEDKDLGGSTSWIEQTEIELTKTEVKSRFGGHVTRYEGEFSIHPVYKADRFPFDTINLELHYEARDDILGCKGKVGALLQPPRMLDVTSNISGFVIGSGGLDFHHYQGRTTVRLQLTRTRFLRWMGILLAFLGFISSLLVVQRIKEKGTVDWAPLAYLVALWGARNMILAPIPEPRPFPTLVDVTVLYLFALTFGAWTVVLSREWFAKQLRKEDTAEMAVAAEDVTMSADKDVDRKPSRSK